MSYENIQYLYFLPLAAVPLIIYLIFRKKPEKMIFGSLYLLKDIAVKIKKLTRLKDIILLIIRTLIILFIILLFSGPFTGGSASYDPLKKNTSVIYLDSSPSMADRVNGNSKFIAARNILISAIAGSGEKDLFYIYTSDPAEKFRGGRKDALKFVSECSLYGGERIFDDFITAADSTLHETENTNRIILALTDGFVRINEDSGIPDDIITKAVLFEREKESGDISLDSAYMNERSGLNYNLSSTGGDAVINVFADGRKIYTGSVEFKERPSAAVSVGIPENGPGEILVSAVAEDDNNNMNNNFNSVIPEPVKNKVLLVGEKGSEIIKNITAIQKIDKNAGIVFSVIEPGKLASVRLTDFDVVLFTTVNSMSTYLASVLRSYVEQGGAVFFAAGADMNLNDYNSYLIPQTGLPVIQGFEAPQNSFFSLEIPNLDHPLFKNVFSESFKGINSVEIYGMYKFSPDGWEVIIISAGHPFLMEKHLGKGKIFLMASGFEKTASNITENGFAVPLLLNSVSYLSGTGISDGLSYKVGDLISMKNNFYFTGRNKQFIPGKYELSSSFVLQKEGFYNLYDSEGTYIKAVAVNNVRENYEDRSEYFINNFHSVENYKDIADPAMLITFEKSNMTIYLLLLILLLAAADIIIVRKM